MSADPDIAARYLPARRASVEGRRSSVSSLASRASNASSGVGTRASSAVVDAAASERLRRRRGAFKRQGTIKKLLRTMNIDWMARFEQNRAVYTTEVIVVVLSVVAYCLETVPSLEGTVDRVVWCVVATAACACARSSFLNRCLLACRCTYSGRRWSWYSQPSSLPSWHYGTWPHARPTRRFGRTSTFGLISSPSSLSILWFWRASAIRSARLVTSVTTFSSACSKPRVSSACSRYHGCVRIVVALCASFPVA